jgi:type IV pilus assembly protein PilM
MTAPKLISRLINDPPPRYVFELSEAGIAMARSGRPPQLAFQELDPGVIAVSPVQDNILRMDVLQAKVAALAPKGEKKRQRAALILPDFAVRTSVLDFDAFPQDAAEQRALVRFRIKKTVPFDVESAGLSYYAQQGGHNGKKNTKFDVVVSVAPYEILARYEAPFRAAGFEPGVVTTSALCALEMVRGEGVSVMAKLCGRGLILAVIDGNVLKLLRTIDLEGGTAAEVAGNLFPTFAYVEDQLAARPRRVLACGFGPAIEDLRRELMSETDIEVEPLRSRFGAPDQHNAGLLGFLEGSEEFQR